MTINEAHQLISTQLIAGRLLPAHWADLGCGNGLFTMALSRMLQPGSKIYGVDRNNLLEGGITSNGIEIIPIQADFTGDGWALTTFDGILMANSLHYVPDKPTFINKIKTSLKPGAVYLIAEYDTDIPVARWVPYPVSFLSLKKLFIDAGYVEVQKLAERTSVYGRGNIYSALVLPPPVNW